MLLQCPDCHGPISKSASACPNCGHVIKGRWSVGKILIAIPICAVIWQFTYGGLIPTTAENQTSVTSDAPAHAADLSKSEYNIKFYGMHSPISYAKGQVIVDSVTVTTKAAGYPDQVATAPKWAIYVIVVWHFKNVSDYPIDSVPRDRIFLANNAEKDIQPFSDSPVATNFLNNGPGFTWTGSKVDPDTSEKSGAVFEISKHGFDLKNFVFTIVEGKEVSAVRLSGP